MEAQRRSSLAFADMSLGGPRSKLLLLLVCLLPCLVAKGVTAQIPLQLVLYAHESDVPPSNTVTVSAGGPQNATMATFGLIRTFANVLKTGADANSTTVGSQVGIVVVGKGGSVYVSFTYYLNTNSTDYKGTIAVQGHIDGTSPGDQPFAVIGGTGDFNSVSGVDVYTPDASPVPTDVVNQHSFTIFRPNWAPAWPSP